MLVAGAFYPQIEHPCLMAQGCLYCRTPRVVGISGGFCNIRVEIDFRCLSATLIRKAMLISTPTYDCLGQTECCRPRLKKAWFGRILETLYGNYHYIVLQQTRSTIEVAHFRFFSVCL